MRTDRQSSWLVVTLAIVLVGCGTSSTRAATATSKAASPSPDDIKARLLAAVARTFSDGVREDTAVAKSLAATGSAVTAMGGPSYLGNATIRTTYEQESPRRSRYTQSDVSGNNVSIALDGASYLSIAGGPFTEGFTIDSGVGPALALLVSVSAVAEAGPGSADGVTIDRLHVEVDRSKARSDLLAEAPKQGPIHSLVAAMSFDTAALDVSIDQSGHIVRLLSTVHATVNAHDVDPTLTGTVTYSRVDTVTLRDFGAAIVVTPPPVG